MGSREKKEKIEKDNGKHINEETSTLDELESEYTSPSANGEEKDYDYFEKNYSK